MIDKTKEETMSKTEPPEGIDVSDLDLSEYDAEDIPEQTEPDDVDHDAIPEGFEFEEDDD